MSELASELRAAIATGEQVELDASTVWRVDATGVQLLFAAVVAARAHGHAIAWRAVPQALHDGARALGLAAALGLEEIRA